MAELTIDDIEFLAGRGYKEIHREMLDGLPEELDKTEGGFAWDFTAPTAKEEAKFIQEDIVKALSCIFPMFAFGQWLDYHGEMRSLTRKAATKATGFLAVTAKAGSEVPAGSTFATIADDTKNYIEFETMDDLFFEDDDSLTTRIQAVAPGISGNVAAHSILAMTTNINGVTGVDNATPTTGGTEVENDDDFRERILFFDRTRNVSFVGSKADYKRWATEVDGVGHVEVIPAQDTTGLVTLVLTDSNGDPASEELINAVYNHIASPDNTELALTNVNALLSVVASEAVTITITATVEPEIVGTMNAIKTEFIARMKQYFVECEGEVKYSRIARILSETGGVNDYSDLLMNNGTANITLNNDQLPVVTMDSVTLSEGAV